MQGKMRKTPLVHAALDGYVRPLAGLRSIAPSGRVSGRSTAALSLLIAALTTLAAFPGLAAAHSGAHGKAKRARTAAAREGIAPQRAREAVGG
jgi:hypothetical protein